MWGPGLDPETEVLVWILKQIQTRVDKWVKTKEDCSFVNNTFLSFNLYTTVVCEVHIRECWETEQFLQIIWA